jgi:hypothetical protein
MKESQDEHNNMGYSNIPVWVNRTYWNNENPRGSKKEKPGRIFENK